MKGSIRFVVGLLVLFGVAGGIDNATDSQLLTLILVGAASLGVMASGTKEMNRVEYR